MVNTARRGILAPAMSSAIEATFWNVEIEDRIWITEQGLFDPGNREHNVPAVRRDCKAALASHIFVQKNGLCHGPVVHGFSEPELPVISVYHEAPVRRRIRDRQCQPMRLVQRVQLQDGDPGPVGNEQGRPIL